MEDCKSRSLKLASRDHNQLMKLNVEEKPSSMFLWVSNLKNYGPGLFSLHMNEPCMKENASFQDSTEDQIKITPGPKNTIRWVVETI